MSGIQRRQFLAAGTSVVGIAMAGCLDGSAEASEAAQFDSATVYLEPNCSCCGVHSDYLESADADITIQERSNDALSTLKTELGIPSDLWSCHTTEIDAGYFIEGHVPVEIINEVLEREPDVTTIALPGMPSGSPGMPGSKDDEWVFYGISANGDVSEFTRK